MKKQILLLLSCIVFLGCVPTRVPESLANYNPSTSENGLVVGSFTFTNRKPLFNHYFPRFVSDVDSKVYEFMISPKVSFGEKHIGELNEGRTYLFVIEKAPGNYNLNSIRFFSNYAIATVNNYVGNFSIPFTIEKGKISYIGEIVFDEYAYRYENQLKIEIADQFDRDLAAMAKKHPKINWLECQKSEIKLIK